ncbi:head maturation protease, ClpP-related [Gracilibacillus sp. YIM 98692]|uniref:head maturation protease, ClpP-related n=1 Tax=Gracilibacillus sp. YIM 98692 TaxID=2663532 RepID=UPI001F09BCF3|nr:head maturation protease, ClpP-related [Gracilibacillus sp. YIM 98692]
MKKISIRGPIISSNQQWIYDWLDMEATSPKKVNQELEQATNNEEIEVEINSGGGYVFEGSEIYTALKSYQGNVKIKVLGIAASAASVIAMAGNKVAMAPTAQMMIHNASSIAMGDYRDMDHESKVLKNVNQTISSAYRIKTGMEEKELLEMMDEETWLTPQQAKEQGFIDEIMFDNEMKFVASEDTNQMLPQAVIDKLRNEFLDHKKFTNYANEEESAPMDLEKLKNDYPDLYEQVKNEGYQNGTKDENNRIKAIEDLDIPGSEELINKAKFETNATAEKVAMDIIKAQKTQGQNIFNQTKQEAKELDDIQGSEAPENKKPEEQEIEEKASSIANFINKKRGGNK